MFRMVDQRLRGRRVVVTGGRDYDDLEHVFEVLNGYAPIHVAHGDAKGVDTMVLDWARTVRVVCTVYPAKWDDYGASAGPIRNGFMLEDFKPDFVLAFKGGAGTENAIKQAHKNNIKVIRV